ncbi:ABC transporter permease [Nonomuraea africana]|uniref:ABC transporter permease n=1 Tax=Nonomuraea africana TaxID=46171 RepID=A0ABR9KSU8_9ACTN|nr:ABC transporter permease [Nonomuraea africana]MBE1565112.1 hypothetical protein [Nonomuraea africana]
MIWLTWRQHRGQLLVTFGLLAALGVMFLVSGLEAAAFVAANGSLAPGDLAAALGKRYDAVYTVFGWLPIVAPALIGAFWGAPLLGKEFERGTHRLVWTQAVPARRWLAVKLAVLGGLVALGGLAMAAMVSVWRPRFRTDTFGNVGVFNMLGVEPAAWWLFAFLLGTAAGAVLRRTLAAMAVVVGVLAVMTFGLFTLSDHYATPSRVVTADQNTVTGQDVRLVEHAWLDPAGREVAEPPAGACPRGVDTARGDSARSAYEECLIGKGYRHVVYFHGRDRFWRFQLIDAAILLTAASALGLVTVRAVRRAS